MDRPILFSGPMIRAILDGRKTQTRRIITKKAAHDALAVFGPKFLLLPGNDDLIGYAPGDRLWARENWRPHGWFTDCTEVFYEANKGQGYTAMSEQIPYGPGGKDARRFVAANGKWRPSIHMPRWASRLTLTVTDVRVQRLQDISEDDAVTEGAPVEDIRMYPEFGTARHWFRDLWDSLNAKRGYGWDANPWVVAITFTAHQCNIDQTEATQ